MKLVSLKTEGFKRLRNHSFSFTNGLNVIVGENAAGKSTLLQALECALFGPTVVPGKTDNIITWGQKTWKVELHFMVNDAEYLVTRTKSTAKLQGDDGALVANGSTPVTKAIEEMLSLSAKDYNLFMQSKQGETAGVLTFGAAALNRKVEEFSGISLIDDVQQLAMEDHRNAKAKMEANEVSAEDMTAAADSLSYQAGEVKLLGFNVEVAVQAFEAAVNPDSIVAPTSDPDVMEKQRTKVTQLRNQADRLVVERDNAAQRLTDAQQRLADLVKPEEAAELTQEFKTLSTQTKEAVAEVNTLQREFDRQVDLWNAMEAAIAAMEKDRREDGIGEDLAKAVNEASDREAKVDARRDELATVAEKIKQLSSLKKDAKCPTCNTVLTEHDPEKLAEELATLEASFSDMSGNLIILRASLKKANERVDALEEEFKTAQANEAKVDTLREQLTAAGVDLETAETATEAQLAEAKTKHQTLSVQRATLEYRLEQNETEWARYRRAEKVVDSEAKALDQFNLDLSAIDGELTEVIAEGGEPSDELIAESRELWKEYHKLVAEARMVHTDSRAEVELAKQAFANAEREFERCQKGLADLEAKVAAAKEHERTADKAARMSKFLRERRSGYLQEVWDAVLGSATRQIGQATRGGITGLSFKEGEFLFEEEGILAPITSASGAQKAYIGTAVRIGLSRALYGKDALLIFDEPTESMSEQNASGLSASLASVASQCLLITHREQDQDLAANVIEVAA